MVALTKRPFTGCNGKRIQLTPLPGTTQETVVSVRTLPDRLYINQKIKLSSILYLLLVYICLPTFLKATDLKVWLETTSCRPGDLIELHAELEKSDFAEFSIQIPKHKALYFVSKQSLPTNYNGETYLQKTIWQLQAMQPGNIELTGILATIQTGAVTHEQIIEPLSLTVTPYKTTEDVNAPLPLPDDLALEIEKPSAIMWIIGGGILIIVFSVILTRNKRTHTDNSNQTSEPTLKELVMVLEGGQPPLTIIESVLNNSSIALSKDARSALEHAAYSKGSTIECDALLAHLRKESSV